MASKSISKKIGWVASSNKVIFLSLACSLISIQAHSQCGTVAVTPTSAVTCNGASTTFTASGGSNYRWYKGTPIPANLVTSGTSTFIPTSSGSYFLVGTDNCSQDQVKPFSIVISTTPSVPSVTNELIPYNSSIVVRPNQALETGESFKWYASNQTTLLHQGDEFYAANLTQASTTYYVSKTNGYCESGKDQFTISTDELPDASAGNDVTVTLPASSAVLTGSGSDAEGSVTFQWLKLSGPSITLSSGVTTNELTLTNITAGTYAFRLAVTDEIGQRVVKDVVLQANSSGTADYNYTRQEEILVKGITNLSQVPALTVDQKASRTTYLDELGKPMESVAWQSSPGKYDFIVPYVYDKFGRNGKRYLPEVSAAIGDGVYKEVLDEEGEYFGSEIQNLYSDKPYAVTIFDDTPLSRTVEQGSEGASWQPGSTSGTTKITYGANTGSVVRVWTINTSTVSTGLPESSTTWDENKLSVKTITSEISATEESVTQVFQDARGLKVLARVKIDASNWVETYYVYDSHNILRFIIPPQLSADLKTAGNYTVTLDQVNRLCFQYRYDNLDRVMASKGPGTDWVYAVSDIRNRVVLTQDGNQRLNNEWTYFEYDEFDRQTVSGIFQPASGFTPEYLQSVYDGTVSLPPSTSTVLTGTNIVSSSKGNYVEFIASNSITLQAGFTANASVSGAFRARIYPLLEPGEVLSTGSTEPLAYTYYDDYSGNAFFQDGDFQFYASETWETTVGAEPFEKFDRVKGQITGTSVKILDSEEWLNMVIYYDKYQAPIQMISSVHTGGVSRVSTLHDFAGKVLETKSSQSSQTITRLFTYDHAGRVLKVYHKINEQPKVLLSAMEYDELGRLVDKKVHSEDDGSTYLQSLDYEYNIKGWLTAINTASGTDPGDSEDYFAMEFAHESNAFNSGNVVRKDGYPTAIKWRQDLNGDNQKLYNYEYDELGRLFNANFKALSGGSWSAQVDHYSEKALQYDLNGNITALKRYTNEEASAGLIDDLDYDYGSGGNQLMHVTDNGTALIEHKGFNDGNTSGNDYTYDVDGNMTFDKNKDMTIAYNHLNLPDKITFGDNSYIQYTYDAGGTKLSQSYYDGNNELVLKTDYSGEFVYLDDVPALIHHEEGRLVPPSFHNLIDNREANSTEGYTASGSVALTSVSQNGQSYVKAVCNQSTGTPGVYPIGGTISVKAGEKYSFKILGYRETPHNANLYVWGSAGDLVWTGPLLPEGLANETWATSEFNIPSGVTQIKVGVRWSAPASGATLYINRVALYKLDWEYQYFIPDHLGSPRVVLQTEEATLGYTATMESENLADESGKFLNIDSDFIETNPGVNATPGGNQVIRMTNAYPIGPLRSMKVYPGDVVDAQVSAYYPSASGLSAANRATMASTLISLLTGEPQAIADGVNAAYNASGNPKIVLAPNQGASKPSAFLNYILFDETFQVLEAKSAALGGANSLHVIAIPQVEVKEVGTLLVYLSYDNENTNPVYFDEMKIIHQESPVIQVNAYYPYGMTAYSWVREGENENKYLYQGKEVESLTGWHDFHARQYDAALGRWFAADPAGQFASPYSAMGNNPVLTVDPDGRFAWFVPIIIGAVVGGTSHGIAAVNNGGNFFDGFWKGALIGAAAGATGIGATAWASGASFTAVGAGTASAGFGASLLGGVAGGTVSGGLGAALYGGNVGLGLLQGAFGGAVGGLVGFNVPGIVPGSLLGGAAGGLTGGLTAEVFGGNFGEGFISGAISGAITGGIFGGISAAKSNYERNILFGGVTRSGKQHFLNDLAISSDAYSKGLNKVELSTNLGENTNGVTKAIVNGNEVSFSEYSRLLPGAGTKANIYMKPASLRQMASTFGHEMVHVSDIYSGYGRIAGLNLMIKYRMSYGGIDWGRYNEHIKGHFEYRAYQYNINHGYSVNTYRNELLKWIQYGGL